MRPTCRIIYCYVSVLDRFQAKVPKCRNKLATSTGTFLWFQILKNKSEFLKYFFKYSLTSAKEAMS